jgi:excisionase family DNA binding protein
MVAMVMTEERLLTVEQVAEEMQVSGETVRRWLRSGRLRGWQPGGTKIGWRIPASEVRRLVQEGLAAEGERPE